MIESNKLRERPERSALHGVPSAEEFFLDLVQKGAHQ